METILDKGDIILLLFVSLKTVVSILGDFGSPSAEIFLTFFISL